MIDIIYPEAEEQAKKQGIKPLVIGREVTIANTLKEIKNATTIIVLTNNLELINQPIDGITNIENNPRKDHTHYKKGGLDQVNIRAIKKNEGAYIINLEAIKNNNKPEQLLGRITQNTVLTKKNNVPTLLFSFAKKNEELPTKKDLEAFYKTTNISNQTNNNQKNIEKWLTQAQTRASKEYIAKGIKKTL